MRIFIISFVSIDNTEIVRNDMAIKHGILVNNSHHCNIPPDNAYQLIFLAGNSRTNRKYIWFDKSINEE